MFKVTGTHTVYVTGNYIMPADPLPRDDYDSEDDSEDDEEDYDSDELDMMDEDDSESDELDDLENPRVQEITSEDEKEEQQKSKKDKKALPAAEEKKDKKGKNKRPAEEENLDEMISKEDKKKVKKNDGKAAPVEEKKKVQFAKNLEQGPTPSPPVKNDEKKPATPTVREVQGVLIDDRKIGTGKVAKKGNTVAMRYIGKLENGKVFDSNKSGKPFSFKLGSGEVIKGWDIGVPGMSVGGERRITIPAHLAYGKRGVPGIPPNATLKFDIKLISIK